jgi:hypothetical protein
VRPALAGCGAILLGAALLSHILLRAGAPRTVAHDATQRHMPVSAETA